MRQWGYFDRRMAKFAPQYLSCWPAFRTRARRACSNSTSATCISFANFANNVFFPSEISRSPRFFHPVTVDAPNPSFRAARLSARPVRTSFTMESAIAGVSSGCLPLFPFLPAMDSLRFLAGEGLPPSDRHVHEFRFHFHPVAGAPHLLCGDNGGPGAKEGIDYWAKAALALGIVLQDLGQEFDGFLGVMVYVP